MIPISAEGGMGEFTNTGIYFTKFEKGKADKESDELNFPCGKPTHA